MIRARKVAALWIAAVALSIHPAAAQAEVDLLGTWYVLIHYRDSATNNPDFDRWLDRIWQFEKKGSRIQWTEYPIVVFQDQAGRFERFRGVRSRVLAYWEPNANQRSQIQAGLEINSRGSKTKSLRGSPKKGYRSTSRMRAQSASVIGYVENWSVEDLQTNPVFTFDDIMGSGRTESMEGRTRYTTTAVGDDGNLLEGTFNRDGTRIGTFQLIRAGQVARVADKSKKVERERQQLFVEGLQRQLESGELTEVGRSGDRPVSAETRAATGYVLSLPEDQREALLGKLDGRSEAEQAVIMREHFETLPPEEQERLRERFESLGSGGPPSP